MNDLSDLPGLPAQAITRGTTPTVDAGEMLAPVAWRRRELLGAGAGLVASAVLAGSLSLADAAEVDPNRLELPPLPYAVDALAPVLSPETIATHYGKHHAGYYANLAKLVAGKVYASMPLTTIVREAAKAGDGAIFNNSAQAWNHDFYWRSMRSHGGGLPPQALREAIETSWPSVDVFRDELTKQAVAVFGSGWLWIAFSTSTRKVILVPTANAQTPLTTSDLVPLGVIDVWEHAYYIDYRNRRADYVAALLNSVFDWGAAEQRYLEVAKPAAGSSQRQAS